MGLECGVCEQDLRSGCRLTCDDPECPKLRQQEPRRRSTTRDLLARLKAQLRANTVNNYADGKDRFTMADVAEAAARITELEGVLRQAGQWFEEYAAMHAARGSDEKSQRNQERADSCFKATGDKP